jgi:DAK2 domain fusion protein YloV
VSELATVRELAAGALASLEANRRRIDDLNVYPVPDGDTGTNLTLTVRGVVDALEHGTDGDRATLAHELTRAALMSARGNSGVILSQIVRGAAEVLAEPGPVDSRLVARAFRGASDAAYRAVRKPVEGTMLTVVRSFAEAAERKAHPELGVDELLPELVAEGEETLARTPEMLDVLREAGVVDAGGAGLLELLRGITATVRGEALPDAPVETELSVDAVHQELSEFQYCTVFVVEGEGLDADVLEEGLDQLGDSLLVVGDETALKVHVHTDDPGAALSLGVRQGTIDRIEIANMHAQTVEREVRLTEELPVVDLSKTTEIVAVVAGAGNRRLFASLGAGRIIEGGQTMNPSTQDIVDAIEATPAPEVVVLPNNSNVVMSAEQAARLATKPVRVVRTESIPAGLAALVVYDAARSAEANVGEMHEALAALATGAVTIASRDAEVDGVAVRQGEFLGLVDDHAVAAGVSFDEVARAVLGRLLAEPRDVLTLLTGAEAPALNGLRAWVGEQHPDLEVEVQDGGQPHYPLLISAE